MQGDDSTQRTQVRDWTPKALVEERSVRAGLQDGRARRGVYSSEKSLGRGISRRG
jgi:hypothetical protein